jgi:hypothetical protein
MSDSRTVEIEIFVGGLLFIVLLLAIEYSPVNGG